MPHYYSAAGNVRRKSKRALDGPSPQCIVTGYPVATAPTEYRNGTIIRRFLQRDGALEIWAGGTDFELSITVQNEDLEPIKPLPPPRRSRVQMPS